MAVPNLPSRTRLVPLLILAVLSFLFRLWVVHEIPSRPVSDFWSYQERALHLLHSGTYQALPGKPDASYPPGYALVLALAFAIAPSLAPVEAGQVLNCLLGGVSTFFAGLLGQRLSKSTAGGVVASMAHALFPRAVLMTTVLASENLFTPLLLAWALVLTSEDRTARPAATFGILSGLLALTRSVAYPASGLWLLRLLLRRHRGRRALGQAAVVLALQHAVLLPWGIRNAVTLGSFSLLTTTSGINLFIGNGPGATGAWYDWRPALARLDPATENPWIAPIELDRRARNAALDWMRANPGAALRLYFEKLRIIFGDEWFLLEFAVTGKNLSPPWPASDVLPEGYPALGRAGLFQFLLRLGGFSLLLAGALCVLSVRWLPFRSDATLLLASAALFPLVAALYLASTRFRWPAEDLFLPLVAAALVWGIRKGAERIPR